MSDDVRTLTARLAEEPGSLAFLELGETLRRRGRFEAALKVARGGLSRYPGLADAHDLVARVLCDRGELHAAFEAWTDALRVDPMHPSTLKGLGFLYFRAGDVTAAQRYLERALEADPDDPAIPAALARVSTRMMATPEPVAVPRPAPASGLAVPELVPAPGSTGAISADHRTAPDPPASAAAVAAIDGAEAGTLLVDASGLRLRGRLLDAARRDISEPVAAELAGVSKEATRTARLLALGSWERITVESPDGYFVLVAPTAETVLLASPNADVPPAQLHRLADRAAREARMWLERAQ